MANRYLVGTGNWNNTTTVWSDSDGGAPGNFVPVATDDVFCTATSGAVTLTISSASECLSLDCTGFTGTLTGNSTLVCYGNFKIVSGMAAWTHTGNLTISPAAGTASIDFGGKTRASGILTLAGAGEKSLASNITLSGAASYYINFTNGTLTTNNYNITTPTFRATGSNTRTVNMGSSTLTINGSTDLADFNIGLNITVNTGTSTVTFTGNANSGNLTATNWAFYNLSIKTGAISLIQIPSTIGNDFTLLGNNDVAPHFKLNTDITVTGAFTLTGNSETNRVMLSFYDNADRSVTITAATTSLSNADIRGITGAGAAAWTGTSLGDCGGNSGITFTTPVNRYWKAVSGGNWNTTASWSATSGGATGASVPLPQDTAYIDVNSITSGSRTITINQRRFCAINASGVLNSPTLAFTGASSILQGHGSINLGGVTPSQTGLLELYNLGNCTITSNGKTLTTPLALYGFGTVTLADAAVFSGAITHYFNGFLTGNYSLTCATYDGTAGGSSFTRALTLGSSTVTLTSTGTVWNISTGGMTFDAGTSTIKMTNTGAKTFSGGGLTYYDVWNAEGAGAGIFTISGSNTYHSLKDDGTAAHQFKVTAGTTQTMAAFPTSGNAGQLITLTSTSTATFNWVYNGVGTVSCDYLDISHCVASPANTWYAGTHSTNSQATATAGSGWIFTDPPSNSATSFFLAGD